MLNSDGTFPSVAGPDLLTGTEQGLAGLGHVEGNQKNVQSIVVTVVQTTVVVVVVVTVVSKGPDDLEHVYGSMAHPWTSAYSLVAQGGESAAPGLGYRQRHPPHSHRLR